MRIALILLAAVALASCGDSTGPSMPDIQGTYDYVANFNDPTGWKWSGTISVFHTAGQETFTGTYSASLINPSGGNEGVATGDIVSATIARDGTVRFNFRDAEFRHDGTASGNAINGTWIISGDGESFAGTFTASKR